MLDKLKRILLSISLFSRAVIGIPLRRYQVGPLNAIIESILHRRGNEFLLVFPRQSGKDEAIAQLLTYLLLLFHRTEASIVHVYPTAQQIATGTTRLERRLDNILTNGKWWTKSKPIRRGLGLAQCAFFSAHPQARAEGATANILLVVNEVQDCAETVVERRFTPMRASTNATALYVGTVRTTTDYLWTIKNRLEKQQAADGVQRVFIVSPDTVGDEHPPYAEFVRNQVKLKGRHHPSVKTELFNEPLDTAAGLFPPRRIALMRGRHPRQRRPEPNELYIITVDVGGQDEAATSAFSPLSNPKRDYTAATMFRVLPAPSGGGATFQAVDIFTAHGARHFQDVAGAPSLFAQLVTLIDHWQPIAIISDFTGVGQGITDALTEKYPERVFPFDFAKSNGKAQLGNDFLSLIETGRFKYFDEGDEEGSDEWFFFEQCRRCGYELAEGVPIERGLRWSVPETATHTVNGKTQPVHDDRLLSAALIAHADRLQRTGGLFFTSGKSAVIPRNKTAPDQWH